MDATLERYLHLTEIDALIVRTREQLEAYPRLIEALEATEAQQERTIAEARERAEAAATERRAAEKAVLELREKVRKFNVQQAAVKTNKEYDALNHEIDRVRGQIDDEETRGLEKLSIEEECAATLAEADEQLKRLGERNSQERHRIEQQTAEKRERLERLEAERAEAIAPLDPAAREEYEAADGRNPGSACAALEGDHCAACGWLAVPHVRQGVAHGELVRCQNCRRFLHAKG